MPQAKRSAWVARSSGEGTGFIFNVEVIMVACEVLALDKVTRLSEASVDLRKPAQFGRAYVFGQSVVAKECPTRRKRGTHRNAASFSTAIKFWNVMKLLGCGEYRDPHPL